MPQDTQETDWIEWKGGECPVDPKTRVDVKWSDDEIERGFRAESHQWNGELPLSKARLIAYRVVSL